MWNKYGPECDMILAEAMAYYSSCENGVHGKLVRDAKTGVLECQRCRREF